MDHLKSVPGPVDLERFYCIHFVHVYIYIYIYTRGHSRSHFGAICIALHGNLLDNCSFSYHPSGGNKSRQSRLMAVHLVVTWLAASSSSDRISQRARLITCKQTLSYVRLFSFYTGGKIPRCHWHSHSRRVRGGPQVAPPVVLGLMEVKK